jgi:hypothetical protein
MKITDSSTYCHHIREANEGTMFVSVNELAQDNTPLVSIPDYSVDVVYRTPELYTWNPEPVAPVFLDLLKVCMAQYEFVLLVITRFESCLSFLPSLNVIETPTIIAVCIGRTCGLEIDTRRPVGSGSSCYM